MGNFWPYLMFKHNSNYLVSPTFFPEEEGKRERTKTFRHKKNYALDIVVNSSLNLNTPTMFYRIFFCSYLQSAKILLVPPKFEIIMVLFNGAMIFSIVQHIVIALPNFIQQKMSLFHSFFVYVLYIHSWLLFCIALRIVVALFQSIAEGKGK